VTKGTPTRNEHWGENPKSTASRQTLNGMGGGERHITGGLNAWRVRKNGKGVSGEIISIGGKAQGKTGHTKGKKITLGGWKQF